MHPKAISSVSTCALGQLFHRDEAFLRSARLEVGEACLTSQPWGLLYKLMLLCSPTEFIPIIKQFNGVNVELDFVFILFWNHIINECVNE